MADNDPRSIVVFKFDDKGGADEMLVALNRMSNEGTLLLQDAVFVSKDGKGKVRVTPTTDPSPGQAAWSGAFWGLLFGILLFVPIAGMAIGAGSAALMAKLIDTGISDDFIKQLRGEIEPGKVFLAAMISHVNPEKSLEEMRRYAGMATVVSATLPPENLAQLEEALGQHPVTEGVSDEESTIAE